MLLTFPSHDRRGAASSVAGTVTYLSNIVQGDGSTNRDGDSVKLKSITLRGKAHGQSATLTTFVRIILVMDEAPVAANITPSNVYTAFSGESTDAFRQLGFTKRMTVLYDKLIKLGTTASEDGSDIKTFKKFIKIDKHLKYEGVAGTIADATRNALFSIVFTGS